MFSSREVISRGLSYDHKWENLFKMNAAMNSVFMKEVRRRLFWGVGWITWKRLIRGCACYWVDIGGMKKLHLRGISVSLN